MPRVFSTAIAGTLLVLACATAHADDARDEFWPEVDAFVPMGNKARLMLMASGDRSKEADYHEATAGILVDVFAAPITHLWLHTRPDAAKKHTLMFRAGYHYSWDAGGSPGGYVENRWLVESTGRVTITRVSTGVFNAAAIANRSGIEWRDVDDRSSWRFRNRTRLESDLATGSRITSPYLMVEFFYDSRYDEWNRQLYYAGVDWPVHKKAILDTYYCRQNDSRSSTPHVNAFGLTLRLFF